MSDTSVLVIGAGALGLSAAFHLTERGVSHVVVVDAAHPAGASSGLSVGVVQTQHLTPLNIELRAVAMRTFDRLASDHALEISRIGYARIGFSAEQMEEFERSVEIQHELGIDHPRVLEKAELHELVPDMRIDDVEGALFGPRDGFIDGHLYCGLLVELLTERGVPVLPRTKVTGAERTAEGRHRVSTSREQLEADFVVNAAGAWATEVAALFGTTAPIRAERHQAVIARLPEPLPYTMPCVMTYSPFSGTEGLFFRRERAEELVVGLHSLDPIGEVVDPDDYARSNDFEFLEAVAEGMQHRLPGLEGASLGGGWAGIYPLSADGLPLVGPSVGEPTVIQANGAGGAGIMLSPVIGNLVADWVVDGSPHCLAAGEELAPARHARESTPACGG